jgi:F0F1-type ATP synthase membrane subunit b/b'
VRDSSLDAADMLLTQAGEALHQYERQSKKAKRNLWPWNW